MATHQLRVSDLMPARKGRAGAGIDHVMAESREHGQESKKAAIIRMINTRGRNKKMEQVEVPESRVEDVSTQPPVPPPPSESVSSSEPSSETPLPPAQSAATSPSPSLSTPTAAKRTSKRRSAPTQTGNLDAFITSTKRQKRGEAAEKQKQAIDDPASQSHTSVGEEHMRDAVMKHNQPPEANASLLAESASGETAAMNVGDGMGSPAPPPLESLSTLLSPPSPTPLVAATDSSSTLSPIPIAMPLPLPQTTLTPTNGSVRLSRGAALLSRSSMAMTHRNPSRSTTTSRAHTISRQPVSAAATMPPVNAANTITFPSSSASLPAESLAAHSSALASAAALNQSHDQLMAMLDDLTSRPPTTDSQDATATTSKRRGLHTTLPSAATVRSSAATSSTAASAISSVPALSSTALQSRLSNTIGGILPFPLHFSYLLRVFHALDSTLSMLLHRGRGMKFVGGASWRDELRQAVERVVGKQVRLDAVQQIISIYPTAYIINEKHHVDRFGKIVQDYRIAFPTSLQSSDDVDLSLPTGMQMESGEQKLRRQTAWSSLDESDDAGASDAQSSASASHSQPRPVLSVNLPSRRQELEERMGHYVYEHHQRFLQRLQAQLTDSSSSLASSSSSASTSAGISAFLRTPLTCLRAWYPSFRVDDPSHVATLPRTPLPTGQLEQLQRKQVETSTVRPTSILELARKKLHVPNTIALRAEQRSLGHNHPDISVETKEEKDNGDDTNASPVHSSVAAAPASSSTDAPVAASLSSNPALSVLGADFLASFSARLSASKRAQRSTQGDPIKRAKLRNLISLRSLYRTVQMILKTARRPNMPLNELVIKVRSSGCANMDVTDPAFVEKQLELLSSVLPAWCSIGTNALQSGRRIFRTKDPAILAGGFGSAAGGRDKNVDTIEQATQQAQSEMEAEANEADGIEDGSGHSANASSNVAPEEKSEAVAETRVKVEEGVVDLTRVRHRASAPTSQRSTTSNSLKSEHMIKPDPDAAAHAASAFASSLHQSTGRCIVASIHAPSPRSPLRRGTASNVSSRAAALAGAARRTARTPIKMQP